MIGILHRLEQMHEQIIKDAARIEKLQRQLAEARTWFRAIRKEFPNTKSHTNTALQEIEQ
jgi:hypothetical protein